MVLTSSDGEQVCAANAATCGRIAELRSTRLASGCDASEAGRSAPPTTCTSCSWVQGTADESVTSSKSTFASEKQSPTFHCGAASDTCAGTGDAPALTTVASTTRAAATAAT